MQSRLLRLRKISGWTTTGIPIIIGFVSVIVIPVALATLVGLGILRISWGLLLIIQAVVAIAGIALSIPVYKLMVAISPILNLSLDGPILTLSGKGGVISKIDLSQPHKCIAVVVLDMPGIKVFLSQKETEISFEQAGPQPEELLSLPFCLPPEKESYHGDTAYEFLPAGWKPGMTVKEGGLLDFLLAMGEFCDRNELVPLIAQRKG